MPVALTGAPTTGLDNSVAMLAIAERKAEAAGVDVTWAQGDMASFRVVEQFGLAIIPCRSFLLLFSVETQKSCLARIREHLIDGGLLALNIFNPNLQFMASRLGDKGGEWERDSDGSLAQRHYHTGDQTLVELRQEYDSGPAGARAPDARARYIYRTRWSTSSLSFRNSSALRLVRRPAVRRCQHGDGLGRLQGLESQRGP